MCVGGNDENLYDAAEGRTLEMIPLDEPVPIEAERLWSVRVGGYSVAGRRERNEDYYLIDRERSLWVVSDGIGGAPFGDAASRVACNALPEAWDTAASGSGSASDALCEAIRSVDTCLSQFSRLLGGEGTGATVLAAHLEGGSLITASVGDSGVFLLREGTLSRVGEDGRISSYSNALDEALGYSLDLRPRVEVIDLIHGDAVLLCTDGVWSTQGYSDMASALLGSTDPLGVASDGNPQEMAFRVVKGSDMSDNATAVVLVFEEPHEGMKKSNRCCGSTAAFSAVPVV